MKNLNIVQIVDDYRLWADA